MLHFGGAAIALFLASAAVAQAPMPTGDTSGVQQLFDGATAALDSGDCTRALPMFDRLASDRRLRAGSLAAAAVSVRRGVCLVRMNRGDEGVAAIEAGLPTIRKAGDGFAGDIGQAEQYLGEASFSRFDHDGAIAHFQAWLDLSSGESRVFPLSRLAQAEMFDGGTAALTHIDEALAIVATAAKPDKARQAAMLTIRGRILLNQGRPGDALTELKKALALEGGLTLRVTHAEVALRGDLAQAAALSGKPDEARKYLAYTGQGRIAESPFTHAIDMDLPDCGSETGLRPEDSAIVEFAIDAGGTVMAAQTVYTRGNFAVAAAFASAVKGWLWRPEEIAKLPAFYRLTTRVEVRCSLRGGNLPAPTRPIEERFLDWASPLVPANLASAPNGRERLLGLTGFADAAAGRGEFDRAAAGKGIWAILAARSDPQVLQAFDNATDWATKAGVPKEEINVLRVLKATRGLVAAEYAQRNSDPLRRKALASRAPLLAVAAAPGLADDPLAVDTLLMIAVPTRLRNEDRAEAGRLVRRVAEDGRLPEHAPLRQLAQLWLANDALQDGDLKQAQAWFQRTGLDEQQCALIGPVPALRKTGVSGNDYPNEALAMGFEGWVQLEFNINADGSTAKARPLIAYPPLVFGDAAVRMARDFRYQSSYRPTGGAACSAQSQTINFVHGR